MYPYHFFILLEFSNDARKFSINKLVFLPMFLFSKIFKVIKSFEVMKEWSKYCFMIVKILFYSFSVKESRYASVLLEKFSDLSNFFRRFWDYTWPSNPLYFNHSFLLSKLEHCWVEQ